MLAAKRTHILKEVWSKRTNELFAVIKMSSYTDHCVLCARHCINDVPVIFNKHSSNNYYSDNSDYKDETLSSDVPQTYYWSNIATYNHINLNSSLHCIQHCLSTTGFDRLI